MSSSRSRDAIKIQNGRTHGRRSLMNRSCVKIGKIRKEVANNGDSSCLSKIFGHARFNGNTANSARRQPTTGNQNGDR